MKRPVLTAENVVVQPHRFWGYEVVRPATRRGTQVYATWHRTRAEAEQHRGRLLAQPTEPA